MRENDVTLGIPKTSYRHSTRMYLMKEKQGGPIPTGLKRWPLKHLDKTICTSPSPADPAGCCPLNFLYLVYEDSQVTGHNNETLRQPNTRGAPQLSLNR